MDSQRFCETLGTVGTRARDLSRRVAVLVLPAVLAVTSPVGATAGGPLASSRLARGAFVAGRDGAGLAVLETTAEGTWRICAWRANGTFQRCIAIGARRVGSFAARNDDVLVCGPAGNRGYCEVFHLSNGGSGGGFLIGADFRAASAAQSGWVITDGGLGAAQHCVLLDDAGVVRARFGGVPWHIRGGEPPEAQRMLPVVVGTSLWGIRVGLYELWRLVPPLCTALQPPFALAAAGKVRRGAAVVQDLIARIDDARDAMSRREASAAAQELSALGDHVTAYARAVICRSVAEPRVAVLLDTRDAVMAGPCRVDIWNLDVGRLVASQTVGPPCPGHIALTRTGVWREQGRRWRYDELSIRRP
jgi:hypothetical protein